MKTFIRAIALSNGLINVFGAGALLFAPEWFYQTIGDFPPFNQHYMGDTGAFLLALGLGLLIATRDPGRHRSLIGIAIVGNLVHLGNHLYDDFIVGHVTLAHLSLDTLPVLVLTVLLAGCYWALAAKQRSGVHPADSIQQEPVA